MPGRTRRRRAGSWREWFWHYRQRGQPCHGRGQFNRHTRLRRTAPPAPRRPDWRAICTPGCALFNHRQRFALTGTAASTSGGVRLRRGIHPTKTAAGRSRNERQSSGKLRHPLRQCGENLSLTVGARAAPFGDVGERSTTAGAMACARIERADLNARRFRRLGHCIIDSATS